MAEAAAGTRNAAGGTGGDHCLFIYRLVVPHHVKLTPLMGS